MTGILVCLSAAALGVDYGWQPAPGGGIEYIIQIEPQLVDALKAGRDIFSDLPRTARQVRSYRITVGTGRLPHHGEPPPDSVVVPASGRASESPGDDSREAADDIDLSQLPGPVLRPALTFEDPRESRSREPRRIAAGAEPLNSRMTGYHAKSSDTDGPSANDARRHEASAAAPDVEPQPKSDPDSKPSRKPEGPAQTFEPASPSDRTLSQPVAAAVKSSLMQFGLFASLGCNAFLLWVATGQRSRYRALVRRMFDTNAAPAADALIEPQQPILPRWEQRPDAAGGGRADGFPAASDGVD